MSHGHIRVISLLSDHAVWSGSFPWERVRDPAGALADAARGGAVGTATRVPDAVQEAP